MTSRKRSFIDFDAAGTRGADHMSAGQDFGRALPTVSA
jgi:hypothetical protein